MLMSVEKKTQFFAGVSPILGTATAVVSHLKARLRGGTARRPAAKSLPAIYSTGSLSGTANCAKQLLWSPRRTAEPSTEAGEAREIVRQLTVGVGDCKVSNAPESVLATYALGSCIAIAIYDPVAAVAGLLHFMLPVSSINPEKAGRNPFIFADTGIPLLLQAAYRLGAKKNRLVVRVVGGARDPVEGWGDDPRGRGRRHDVPHGMAGGCHRTILDPRAQNGRP